MSQSHRSVFPKMAFEEGCFLRGPGGSGWGRQAQTFPFTKPGSGVAMWRGHCQLVLTIHLPCINPLSPGSNPMKQVSLLRPFYR